MGKEAPVSLFLFQSFHTAEANRRMCWWRDRILETVAETVEFVSICCSAKSIVHIYKHARRSKLLLAYCLGFCDT